jgi:hypothetical protein
MMKVIPETRRAHEIKYLCFHYFTASITLLVVY